MCGREIQRPRTSPESASHHRSLPVTREPCPSCFLQDQRTPSLPSVHTLMTPEAGMQVRTAALGLP